MKLYRLLLLVLSLTFSSGCSSYFSKRIKYRIEPSHPAGSPQFLRSVGYLLGPGILESNKVTSLVNGEQIFPSMMDAVIGAKKSINLETYIYWSGAIGDQFAALLGEKAKEGVQVRVLVDWWGSGQIDSSLFNRMRADGVMVEKYNALVPWRMLRINHRDHRKLLIVDGKIGFTGGAGIADVWMGNGVSPGQWRDNMFRLEGPAVGQMQSVFMDNWKQAAGEVLAGDDYFPALPAAGNQHVQVFGSSPRDGVETVRMMYLLSIDSARHSIRLCTPYFVPGEGTEEALIRACQRGVKVEMILPGATTDVPIVRHASRWHWGPLLDAGVKFYEYQPTMYHCKLMIVDDVWVSVGSANVDNRSFRLNDESNMNIYSAEFAAEQVKIFEADKGHSIEITREMWKKRSTGKKIMELLTTPFRSQL
jgi:cardiolipin synthase